MLRPYDDIERVAHEVITYLTLTGYQAGLLMNFNEILLKNGLRRLDHAERYARKKR